MGYTIRHGIANTEAPPISESFSWIPADRRARPFITLSQAVPNYPPHKALQDHVAQRAAVPETSHYTDILGIPELRTALSAHLSDQYSGDVQAADIAVTAGGNQAFCLAALALCGAGDNVIIPAPYFFNHQMWFQMQGIEARYLRCDAKSGMLPNPRDAEQLIDQRTRAIMLVTPNNPTGAIYPPDLITAFFELCVANGIALLVDETYKDFRSTDKPAHPLFARADWRDAFVHLHSFSKSFALTGYRCGGLAASPDLVLEIEKLMDCVAICAPRIAQDAALFALTELGDWRGQKAREMAGKLDALVEAFEAPKLRYKLMSKRRVLCLCPASVRRRNLEVRGKAAGAVTRLAGAAGIDVRQRSGAIPAHRLCQCRRGADA